MKKQFLLRLAYRGFVNHVLRKLSLKFDKNLCCPGGTIYAEVTSYCNLKCRHCQWWKVKNQSDITINEWKNTIHRLREWLRSFTLVFLGGEPFLRADLLEMISYSNRLGIFTAVCTNGTVISPKLANEVVSAGLDLILISLDGASAQTHDFLRGAEGTYNKVMQTINYFKGRIPIQLLTTITKYNIEELVDLVEFAQRSNLQVMFFGLMNTVVPSRVSTSVWQDNTELWPEDLNKFNQVFWQLYQLKRQSNVIVNSKRQLKLIQAYFKNPTVHFNYKCKTRYTGFHIAPNGDVYLCWYFPPIGNIRIDSPREIWYSNEAKLRRNQMKECKKNCAALNCYYEQTLSEKISYFAYFK